MEEAKGEIVQQEVEAKVEPVSPERAVEVVADAMVLLEGGDSDLSPESTAFVQETTKMLSRGVEQDDRNKIAQAYVRMVGFAGELGHLKDLRPESLGRIIQAADRIIGGLQTRGKDYLGRARIVGQLAVSKAPLSARVSLSGLAIVGVLAGCGRESPAFRYCVGELAEATGASEETIRDYYRKGGGLNVLNSIMDQEVRDAVVVRQTVDTCVTNVRAGEQAGQGQ